ncbi:hypothetical protein CLOM_g6372 [Closterium sp. NIES-68]|nr:hypothetical protein CLOM_g6372 [Closterium sp. NIES-68]GJP71500.1 hypothetical protein CLOP_g2328 [Closterium sp. NIES-67]
MAASSHLAVCSSLACSRVTKLHSELLPRRRQSSFLLSLSQSDDSFKQPSAFRGASLRATKGFSEEGEKGKRGPSVQKIEEEEEEEEGGEWEEEEEGGEWEDEIDELEEGEEVDLEGGELEEEEGGEDDGDDDVVQMAAADWERAAMAVVVEAIEKQEKDESRRKGWRRRRDVVEEVPEHLLPRVAIVGRPNVGKSALFNRLVGRNIAIVHDEPGVTRDRLYARALWEDRQFLLTDTGGLMDAPNAAAASAAGAAGAAGAATDGADGAGAARRKGGRGGRAGRGSASGTALLALAKADGVAVIGGGGRLANERAAKEAEVAGLPELIGRQAAAAVEEADAIIMVVDGQAGATAADVEIAQWLRRRHVASSKPVFLAVNKCESPTKGLLQTAEFWSLGLTPMAVSALSGTGTGDLLDELLKALPFPEESASPSSLSTITGGDSAAPAQF